MIPVVPDAAVPALTANQMREVDRVMTDELHIDLVQMMENAGQNLAELALRRFSPASVVVLAGAGGNGGGGAGGGAPNFNVTLASRLFEW